MSKILISVNDAFEAMAYRKTLKVLYYLLLPISIVFEVLVYRHFWFKTICAELLTNDAIVDFLDKNEFGYKKGLLPYIYKKHIVEADEKVAIYNLEELEYIVKGDYVVSITKLIEEHSSINVENYVELEVFVDIVPTPEKNKIYSVYLWFYRYKAIKKSAKNLIWWLFLAIFVGVISNITYTNFDKIAELWHKIG